MSRRGKRKDEDEYASDGDLDGSTHPKKAPRTDSDDSDTITICDISRNRRVSVRSWQGKVVVDIREFYMKDGRQMPGKKGISLSMDQWSILRDHLDEIDQAVAENA
ncbi:RNA polymerase II transcriptional coactivator KIWI-like isoform X2 [Magnolia sinica]|uniref:RNA polymerase II transcriptional coactivator KIWI-like isoform X2 n=1 Tax=Magnolia sinica TaxID=86752 RepID=UPI00265B3993|nr:RNA polymerase II transcriptional coactivator KIWI-like isoform X2 [Magnolia sinica]